MKEHGMYFGKKDFYDLIVSKGGYRNDSKERPIVCVIESRDQKGLYWAIPVGNYNHRSKEAIDRINTFMEREENDIRSCYYHIGNTNEKSIFFVSDVVPITDKYIEREYLNKNKQIHIIKNKILLDELNRKLGRILAFENSKPNYFRQHITDMKKYLIEELKAEKEKDCPANSDNNTLKSNNKNAT